MPGISLKKPMAYYISGVRRLTVFSVASARALDAIRHIIGREIKAWQGRGVNISVRESVTGDLLVFRCEIPRAFEPVSEEIMSGLKDAVASGLSHVIIDEYERVLVERLIDDNYGFLSGRDREILRRKVMLRLSGREGQPGAGRGFGEKNRRKSRVWARLAEYLEREDEIVLEGFITFRLKDYLEELFDVVEETAEDYLTEREYREFLKLLRHFMERQDGSSREINVVRAGEAYQILDQNMVPVQGEVGRFLENPPKGMDLGIDDLVVSAVVTLAPSKVVWHGPTEGSACFNLIRDLIEERLTVCPGCPLDSQEPQT